MDPSSSSSSSMGVIKDVDDLRHRVPLAVPNRSDSSSPRPHNHLGLRPKAIDSLHTRLRTANPIPKHVSKIEDVTSFSSKPKRQPTLSREVSSDKEGSFSRSTAADGSGDGGADSPVGNGHAVAGQEEEYEEITTDIGLYDEAVYDEYLGPLMGPLRRRLIKSLRWESPILARHQARIRNSRLDRYFVYTSLLGTHSFFLIFLPIAYWLGNARFARGLVNVLAFGVYFSSAVKDALCIPRPYSPPVTRLVIGTTHLEYGFLSTHSTNCSSVALYLYLWLGVLRNEPTASHYMQSWIFEILLLYYVVSVVYGRIYAGMHSFMDCVMGCALGSVITAVQWYSFDTIETSMVSSNWLVPFAVNSLGLVAVVVHPQPLDDCPCFEDAIAFLSVVMGIVSARWTFVRLALLPLDDRPLVAASIYSKSQAVIEPALEFLQKGLVRIGDEAQTFPFMVLPILSTLAKKMAVIVVGVSTIGAIRIVVKAICRVVLPPIFRFAIGSLGLILPRRHYQATSTVASPQQAKPIRPAHKRRQSSAGGDFFSNISDPREYNEVYWKTDNRSVDQQNDDQILSDERKDSNRTLRNRTERSKVKFTLGDGSDVPVPFTHPNTRLPGDGLSGRLAGAFSVEEKQRQVREMESNYELPTRKQQEARARGNSNASIHGNVNGIAQSHQHQESAAGATTTTVAAPEDANHYDVDVLTKVFVYHAIGFFAGGPLPAFFAKMGW